MATTTYTLHGRHHARLPEDEPPWDEIFGRVDRELAAAKAQAEADTVPPLRPLPPTRRETSARDWCAELWMGCQ